MKLKRRGVSSSRCAPEILNMGPRGMWVLVHDKEYFIDYERYPWFQEATIAQIRNLEVTGPGSGLYWPALDVDVELEALEYPDRYPLMARLRVSGHSRKKRATGADKRRVEGKGD